MLEFHVALLLFDISRVFLSSGIFCFILLFIGINYFLLSNPEKLI